MTERLTRAERDGIRQDAMRWGISPHIDTVLRLLADLERAEAAILATSTEDWCPFCPGAPMKTHAPDCLRAALEKERAGG